MSRELSVAAFLLLLGLVLAVFVPGFYSPGNVTNLLVNMSYLTIAAVGMTAVILTGQINFSSAILAACSTVAGLSAKAGVPIPLVFLLAVLTGTEAFLHPDAIRAACRAHGEPEPGSVGELVRCCLESLALKYRSVLDDLKALTGTPLEVIRIVGGGSQNALLCQYTADACGRPVVAGPVEATALGNLMVQALARGFLPNLEAGRRVVAASSPQTHYDPHDREAWEDAYARFRQLYL